jgi:pimeloyl-ACP methyl ester carboxylesterase
MGGQEIAATIRRSGSPDDSETGKTLILMAHGFPGHKSAHDDFFGDLDAALALGSHDTLRFDFRGCGESDGLEENFTIASACEDFQSVMLWCRREGYSQFIVAGAGLGATIAAMNMELGAKAFIMLWPVLEPKLYFKQYISKAVMADDNKPYAEIDSHRIGVAFIKELKDLDIVSSLKEIYCPTLIMHGSEDEIVPPVQLDLARGFIPARRIEITVFHDGTHGLPLPSHRKAMLYHIRQFVQKYA